MYNKLTVTYINPFFFFFAPKTQKGVLPSLFFILNYHTLNDLQSLSALSLVSCTFPISTLLRLYCIQETSV
jgi:hypothetical protein